VKNVTISLPDQVHRRARVLAAERDMSLSAFVSELVMKASRGETDAERGKRIQAEVLASIRSFRASDRLSRDEIHDRRALR
jgi:hypothetical protein